MKTNEDYKVLRNGDEYLISYYDDCMRRNSFVEEASESDKYVNKKIIPGTWFTSDRVEYSLTPIAKEEGWKLFDGYYSVHAYRRMTFSSKEDAFAWIHNNTYHVVEP